MSELLHMQLKDAAEGVQRRHNSFLYADLTRESDIDPAACLPPRDVVLTVGNFATRNEQVFGHVIHDGSDAGDIVYANHLIEDNLEFIYKTKSIALGGVDKNSVMKYSTSFRADNRPAVFLSGIQAYFCPEDDEMDVMEASFVFHKDFVDRAWDLRTKIMIDAYDHGYELSEPLLNNPTPEQAKRLGFILAIYSMPDKEEDASARFTASA